MKTCARYHYLILVLTLATSAMVFAGTTGKIAGRVTDKKTGEGLPGANVLVTAQLRGSEEVPLARALGASTDLEGHFVIINVPPGRYVMRCQFLGYNAISMRDVAVSIDLTTHLDFAMEEEVLQGQEVMVVAEREIVNKSSTSSQAHVASEQIDALPVQNIQEVLSLQAGVSVGRDNQVHIRGGRSSEVAYYIDGVSVTDAFNGGSAVRVENESVQELQVISGTFNAEYGNVMSGVINVVTKDGSEQYHGTLNLYAGDFVSSDDEYYLAIDEIDALSTYNTQLSLSGPVPGLGNKLTFFATGRYYSTDGWLNGRRMFNIYGDTLSNAVFGGPSGKEAIAGDIVPMNTQLIRSAQFKLTYKLSPSMQLRLGLLGNNDESQAYNGERTDNNGYFRWTPDSRRTKYDQGYNASLQLTHTLGPRAFYTLSASQFYKSFKSYVFADPLDPRYPRVVPATLRDPELARGQYDLAIFDPEYGHYERETTTQVARLDYTSQASLVHQIKLGFEGKHYELFEENINPVIERGDSLIVLGIPPLSSPNHNQYRVKPIELAAYVQDKIEFESVVINAGLRFDYFDANGQVLADPSDPNVYAPKNPVYQNMSLEERMAVWYNDSEPKFQASPRFGVAYPITDKGAIHFSYGHFLQTPAFDLLYQNPGYKVPEGSSNYGIYGYADLKPQKTVMYELGLKQQLGESVGIDITGFYRDVRNWVGVSAPIETVSESGQIVAGRTYTIYRNLDYANVRGVTMTLSQMQSRTFTYSLDYTFQVAEGSNSDPGEEFGRRNDGAEPTQFIVPLSWDQRHTLNGTLSYFNKGWNASLLGRYHSGYPYTPSTPKATRTGQNTNLAFSRNGRVAPYFLVFDLRLSKTLRLAGWDVALLCNVYNLLDRRNEINVYTDTGRATNSTTYREVYAAEADGSIINNTADEYLRQPDRFSEPREVQLGLKLSF